MEKTNKHFISKLTKRSGRIERDREDIEREESDGEIVTDPLMISDESYVEGYRMPQTAVSMVAE